MVCENCPYFENGKCSIEDEEKEPKDECYFPETMMEKGV